MLRVVLMLLTGLSVLSTSLHFLLPSANLLVSASTPLERAKAQEEASGINFEENEFKRLSDRRADFAKYADQVFDRVVRRQLHLGDACDQIFYYCVGRYPEYLVHISQLQPGGSLKDKLTRNVASAIYEFSASTLSDAERAKLQDELQADLACVLSGTRPVLR